MNLSSPEAPDQSALPVCDRVAFYACTTDPNRNTREVPVRAGVEIPARFSERGHDWILVSYVAPLPGESIDAAIVRETRELEDLVAEIRADALAAERVS